VVRDRGHAAGRRRAHRPLTALSPTTSRAHPGSRNDSDGRVHAIGRSRDSGRHPRGVGTLGGHLRQPPPDRDAVRSREHLPVKPHGERQRRQRGDVRRRLVAQCDSIPVGRGDRADQAAPPRARPPGRCSSGSRLRSWLGRTSGVGLNRQRADRPRPAAGAGVRAVRDNRGRVGPPVHPGALGAVETGLGDVAAAALAVLPAERAAALCESVRSIWTPPTWRSTAGTSVSGSTRRSPVNGQFEFSAAVDTADLFRDGQLDGERTRPRSSRDLLALLRPSPQLCAACSSLLLHPEDRADLGGSGHGGLGALVLRYRAE
jgi:hypothetical protein